MTSTTEERINSITIAGSGAGTAAVAGNVVVTEVDNVNEAIIESSTVISMGDVNVVAFVVDLSGTARLTVAGSIVDGGGPGPDVEAVGASNGQFSLSAAGNIMESANSDSEADVQSSLVMINAGGDIAVNVDAGEVYEFANGKKVRVVTGSSLELFLETTTDVLAVANGDILATHVDTTGTFDSRATRGYINIDAGGQAIITGDLDASGEILIKERLRS